jgi:pyruvate/2-oxoglutarate dehydrogenase complex dihydrolipoamide acyltransferase (E2) component
MRSPVVLPELECEGPRLSVWFARVGDRVLRGERLVEIVVEGATIDITAPAAGRLIEVHAIAGDRLTTGQLLGVLDTD